MIAAVLFVVPQVRAADQVGEQIEWVPPAVLDDVPVRAAVAPPTDAAQPQPILVPLPPGVETGALALAAMAAARWWKRRGRA